MEEKICQSCGMNLKSAQDFGTNAETGNNFTPDEARPILREFLSSLKRWKK